jgi:hypothetical protein
MPDDRLRELFGQATAAPVRVPPVSQVRAKGERRRSRARLQASTIAWTIALAAGFGAPQVSGSLAQGTARYGQVPASRSAPGASYPSAPTAGRASSPAPAAARSAISGQPRDRSPSPHSPTGSTRHLAPALPPPGGGQLLLALDSAHRFVMTRLGSAAAPVRVASLTAVAGAPPVLATNPAGGWVVTLASLSRAGRVRGARLAWVVASGHSVPFGPLFRQKAMTSAAVSHDGSRVAVALTIRSGGARIEVLPLPGHQGAKRTWDVQANQASLVTGLSWSPDGRHLSYLADQSSGQSARSAPVFLDTGASVAVVPDQTSAPLATKPGVTGVTCVAKAAAWLGTTGRYAVLSECPSTGAVVLQTSATAAGAGANKPIVVAHRTGCGAATVNSNAAGTVVLITYCGVYVVDRGRLSTEPATLTAAALGG